MANALAVVSLATTELNPLLEYVQNGASVAAVMGMFLWREMKRAERYEKLYDHERKLRIDAAKRCLECSLLRRVSIGENAEAITLREDKE